MIPLFIIFIVLAITTTILACYGNDLFAIFCVAFIVAGGMCVASVAVCEVNIDDSYTKLDGYSYFTESGSIETISQINSKDIFKKDGEYYVLDKSKSMFIPFYPYEFTKVDLPSDAIPTENNS